MSWSLDRSKYHTTKLWRYQVVGGFQPQWQRKISTWLQILEERQMLLDGGGGPLPKVLEAHMGEAALLTNPSEAYLATMLRDIVVLLRQHDDQLNIELSSLEVHI